LFKTKKAGRNESASTGSEKEASVKNKNVVGDPHAEIFTRFSGQQGSAGVPPATHSSATSPRYLNFLSFSRLERMLFA
jgi:hypothetical protein